jgi:hypothetical protein
MDVQSAVLYTADDILNVVQNSYGSSLIGQFIRMTPHTAPPTKDGKFSGGNYGLTPIGQEMDDLIERVLQERGIRLGREDNLTLFTLKIDGTGNQYISIPTGMALSSKTIEKAQLHGRIDGVVKEVLAHQTGDGWGTALEQEFLQVTDLYNAMKRFDHAYFASFKQRHGLPYDDILEASFARVWKTPSNLKKPYGEVEEDSPLHKAIHNLAERSRQTAHFQFSERVPNYADEFTLIARLPKFIYLNRLFVPERMGEMQLDKVKEELGPIDEQHPHYEFVRRWNNYFPIEQKRVRVGDPSEMLVKNLELSVRAQNCLGHANIRTLEELAQKTEAELGRMKNMGRGTVREIKQVLSELEISLSDK